ncbi:hypothetical protein D3C74_285350 [compost metagenome]
MPESIVQQVRQHLLQPIFISLQLQLAFFQLQREFNTVLLGSHLKFTVHPFSQFAKIDLAHHHVRMSCLHAG